MTAARHVVLLVLTGLRSSASRPGSVLVMIVGVAGVVGVLAALLALGHGFRQVMDGAASADRALILRDGSVRELASYLGGEVVDRVATLDGVAVASGELLMYAHPERHGEGAHADVLIRGVDGNGMVLRPELSIQRGRMFRPGHDEVIVGRALLGRYQGLEVGADLPTQGGGLRIVGHFEADGALTESEILMDLLSARSVYRRGNAVNVVRVRLDSPEAAVSVGRQLDAAPDLDLWLVSEAELLAEPARQRSELLRTFALWVVGVMAVGGFAATLTTMVAALSARRTEIGTLRAIGFGRPEILFAVTVEAALWSAVGAAVGILAVAWLYHGAETATGNPQSGTIIAFSLVLTPDIALRASALGVVLGVAGALFAGVRALRVPLARSLSGANASVRATPD